MHRLLRLLALLTLCGSLGCRLLPAPDSPDAPDSLPVFPSTVESGMASVGFVFVLPGGDGSQASIQPAITDGSTRVTFILKVLNEGNLERPFVELRKEVPVVSGTAQVSFDGLALHSLVGEVQITGGQKGGFSSFHGAVDLRNGSNTVEVAPVGSRLEADLVATAIDDLNASTTLIPYVRPNIAGLMRAALSTTTGIVGTSSTQLMENIREVYLAQTSSGASTNATPFVDTGSKYMNSYWTYKDQTYQTPPSASVRGAIRSGVNYWHWDPVNKMWSVLYPGTVGGASEFYAYWFQDPSRNRYSSLSESTFIDQFVTGSIINYAADWFGGFLSLSEIYIYSIPSGFGSTSFVVRLVGRATAEYNSLEVYRIESDVQCDVRQNYPQGGSATIIRNDGSQGTITYNGTCVARYTVVYANGTQESFRLLLGGNPSAPPPPPVPPAAPTGLAAKANVGQVILTWNAVSEAVTYRLYCGFTSGVTKSNGIPLGTVTSPCDHHGLTPGVPYYYVVTAVNADGESVESTEVTATPVSLRPRTWDLGNGVSMAFLAIWPGSFQMGSPWSETFRSTEETQHQVALSKFLIMGKHEVTQAQWLQVMGTNPSFFQNGVTYADTSQHPVENVGWVSATKFCNALSQKLGRTPCYSTDSQGVISCDWTANGFRLPTEAEWEFACRAGTTDPYYWGSSSADSDMNPFAWYCANANDTLWTSPHAAFAGTQPVGTKLPNSWGFHDMVGNVWEWCWDWYSSGYYRISPSTDPHGPDTGTFTVIRGNSWWETDGPKKNRSAYRSSWDKPASDIGLRICYQE